MGLFYKNNGTISVFLCLILLPVILVGGMTVDASRIYLSKVVISDAGEMAMNAGLAQYNEDLHDEFGLLVMERAPEDMSQDLKEYFNTSLNGSGLLDAEDYQKILDLMEEDFTASNVEGSEIYRTEVEKQQIIEYMKYRAPICLTDLILEKFDMFKDTQLMTEAMESQMDFSEAMEDCQDAFQDALTALDTLNSAIENFPADDTVRQELENTERDYKETLSRALLMREVLQGDEISKYYDRTVTEEDLQDVVELYIESAKKVDLSAPVSSSTFNAYTDAMYYENTISKLGGIGKLSADADKENEDSEEENQTENEEQNEDLQKLKNDYNTWKDRIAPYSTRLLETANNIITGHYNTLNGWREAARAAEQAAKTAYDKLGDVKDALTDAEDKFNTWDEKYKALENAGKSGDMGEEVEEYRRFFDNGDGSSDIRDLENLMATVASNEGFFSDFQEALQDEKFHDEPIAVTSPSNQFGTYESAARSTVGGVQLNYNAVDRVRYSYISSYVHIAISTAHAKQSISNDPFYQRLKEYCNSQAGKGNQTEQNKANDTLKQSQNAGTDMNDVDSYPTYNWSAAEAKAPSGLPSSAAGGISVRDADGDLTGLDMDANISSGSSRSGIVKEFRDSIKAANSFLDGVDRIMAKAAENLYIAEYAMQMFSYYTVNKSANGQDKPEQDIISLSGYNLTNRDAYRAEVEYILWGDQSSQKNVGNTMAVIFGIRLLFNSFFAFTNSTINVAATTAAGLIASGAPYLVPILKAVIKLGYACVETADDMQKIKAGRGVTIFKDASTWATGGLGGDNTKKMTFDYSEYLRIFLNVSILNFKTDILARIADCIQLANTNVDLMNSYTMIQVQAKVNVRTTFMRKLSDFGSGGWGFPDDNYTILYQSILGY